MTLSQKLQPLLSSVITSPRLRDSLRQVHEARRRISAAPHQVTAWLTLDDPYSYLLLQVLPRLCQHFEVKLQVRLLTGLPEGLFPEPELLNDYALADASRLAQHHLLSFPQRVSQPCANDTALGNRVLLACEQLPAEQYLPLARQVFAALWEHQPTKLATLAERFPPLPEEEADLLLQQAREDIGTAGHYLSATLQYAGEWYWGLDRLSHLTSRLQGLGAARFAHEFVLDETAGSFNADFLVSDWDQLAAIRALRLPLDVYFSFRSPYSYLALPRVFALAEHYQLRLSIKPVLPMVMRGLPLPRQKRFYILHDAKREAERLGLPFGRICDPLGTGVERCMAIFELAAERGLEQEYLLSVSRGIWAEGRNTADDRDLKILVERSGLNWDEACTMLANADWQHQAARHRQELEGMGLWGVPVFCLQTARQVLSVWGQDRLWAVEAAIADTIGLHAGRETSAV